MELKDIFYNQAEYVETPLGNKVSKKCILHGSQNIVCGARSIIREGTMIRGDLANVRLGRQCVIEKDVILRPPFKKFSKGVAFFPLNIGEYVFIGEGSVVNAAVIGSYVHIGKNCVIGRRCVLKDCCAIGDNTVLGPETCVPCFAFYSGSPGVYTTEQPDCTQDLMIEYTKSYYEHFLPLAPAPAPSSPVM